MNKTTVRNSEDKVGRSSVGPCMFIGMGTPDSSMNV